MSVYITNARYVGGNGAEASQRLINYARARAVKMKEQILAKKTK